MTTLGELERLYEDLDKILNDNPGMHRLARQHLLEARDRIDLAMDLIELDRYK